MDQANEDLFGTMGGSSYRQSTVQRRYGSGFFSARNSETQQREIAASGPKSGIDKMFEPEVQKMRADGKKTFGEAFSQTEAGP